MTNRLGSLLHDWIDQAEQDALAPMRSFAGFLRQDLDVTAGLTLEWSSGKVEGNVNRVKNTQKSHVRPGLVPPPADPNPHPAMSFTELRSQP
ncbi:hypothetical protein [Streptomyces sp. ISL-36]|uniref:hypothetical protein n=1 Tax=Streptomyces sp. ISL-36 TaxID=2819182 RepID=UPI0035A86180